MNFNLLNLLVNISAWLLYLSLFVFAPDFVSFLFISSFSGLYMCFSGRSVGKESVCNAEDPGSIPGSGRSPGEGIGYSLQYSWASLVAQLVKNPPAMRET